MKLWGPTVRTQNNRAVFSLYFLAYKNLLTFTNANLKKFCDFHLHYLHNDIKYPLPLCLLAIFEEMLKFHHHHPTILNWVVCIFALDL